MGIVSTLSDLIVAAKNTGKNPPALDTIIANTSTLTGLTADAAELNVLDGITATTVELNLVADDGQRAVTVTADGLTTGLLTAADNTIVVTSANAAHILTLPAIATCFVGQRIRGYVVANGCKVRTPATTNTTINNVDADGTGEITVAASTYFIITKISTTNWMLEHYTTAGVRSAPTS